MIAAFFFEAIPAFRCNLFVRRKGAQKGFSLQSGLKYQELAVLICV